MSDEVTMRCTRCCARATLYTLIEQKEHRCGCGGAWRPEHDLSSERRYMVELSDGAWDLVAYAVEQLAEDRQLLREVRQNLKTIRHQLIAQMHRKTW